MNIFRHMRKKLYKNHDYNSLSTINRNFQTKNSFATKIKNKSSNGLKSEVY